MSDILDYWKPGQIARRTGFHVTFIGAMHVFCTLPYSPLIWRRKKSQASVLSTERSLTVQRNTKWRGVLPVGNLRGSFYPEVRITPHTDGGEVSKRVRQSGDVPSHSWAMSSLSNSPHRKSAEPCFHATFRSISVTFAREEPTQGSKLWIMLIIF